MSDAIQKKQMQILPRRVFCLETSAIAAGYGLVLDLVSTTDVAVGVQDKARGKYAINPTYAKNADFAGVLLAPKLAPAGWVEVAQPGSDCPIYVTETVTIGDYVFMGCGDTAGQFSKGGMSRGAGAARVCTSRTGAGIVHAKLLTGEEVESLQLLTPVAAGAAILLAPAGMTLINGGTVNDANITATLADGTVIGQRKAVRITTTVGNSKNFVLTVTTGVQLNGSTALATITFNTAAEQSILEWTGGHWKLIANLGATLA